MPYRIFIIRDMFVSNMRHIKDSATAGFQCKKYTCIPTKVSGIEMNHTGTGN